MIHLKIFFGSQTGNSQDLAEKIYRYAENIPLNLITVHLLDLNSLNIDNITSNDIIILICSTTGQGDPPDNMVSFWKMIMNRSFNKSLESMNFGLFGLGDSKYAKYNFIAKKLYRRLLQFKANPIIYLGLADDQHALGIDGEFIPWLKTMWKFLSDKIYSQLNVDNLFENCSRNKMLQKFEVSISNIEKNIEKQCPIGFSSIYLKSSIQMTPPNYFQETKLLIFSSETLKYKTGDIFTVYPKNDKTNVDLFFNLTGLNSENLVNITSLNRYFPKPEILGTSIISIGNLVSDCFDLNSVPRKTFFENFAFVSSYEIEKERLMELSDPKNIDDLYSYCFQPKRTIIEVLQDFPNTTKQVTLSQWVNLMPLIRPRDYSIASSNVVHDQEIQLLVARIKYKTKLFNGRVGLCSNFLCDLNPQDQVFGKIKKGTLKFPSSNVPVILISPGTGVAAFRGYISERMMEMTLSDTLLFFGNRYKDKDFYFSSEFQKFKNENNFKLITAFSREENRYIQNKLKEQSEIIWKIINELNGFIFICGRSVDMPDQVYNEIKNIIMLEGNLTDNEAENFLISMQRFRRYQLETWS